MRVTNIGAIYGHLVTRGCYEFLVEYISVCVSIKSCWNGYRDAQCWSHINARSFEYSAIISDNFDCFKTAKRFKHEHFFADLKQAVFVDITRETATAVATHFRNGAIIIDKPPSKISLFVCGLSDKHNAIGANAKLSVAKGNNLMRGQM